MYQKTQSNNQLNYKSIKLYYYKNFGPGKTAKPQERVQLFNQSALPQCIMKLFFFKEKNI